MISPQLAGLTGVFVPVVIGVGTALGSLLRSLSREAQHQVGREIERKEEIASMYIHEHMWLMKILFYSLAGCQV